MDKRVEDIIQGLKLRGFDDDAVVLEEVYGETLAAARKTFWEVTLKQKGYCPCCDRYAQYYDRYLSSFHVYGLAALYRLDQEESRYYHISEISDRYGSISSAFSKVEYWNLAQRKKNEKETEEDQSKNSTGFWRITELGRQFITGKVGVMSPKVVYNHKVWATGGKLVFAKDCITEKFDYREIMKPTELM